MDAATNATPGTNEPEEDNHVRLQLAIFDVTRDAEGNDLEEIKERLRAEFARRGVQSPPGTWLDSVASAAFYGKPYLVDLPSALAADDAVPAPTEEVREQLELRRELRNEKLPPGTFPAQSDWKLSPDEVTTAEPAPSQGAQSVHSAKGGAAGFRPLIIAGSLAAALVLALVAARATRRGAGRAK
ncbi:hypothetical protein Achl_2767 [Pseudarthrobacter chlorophenolicus A6]|uniref:Uncharacterized protein n=1 Tax=Pseudarthrobacter chlorophenolicus (strain ATCC 700700 / DSM 12829 / CIP 107037 / JCM 12360 / KCTC 9906 / NCIMB 13794 / A6) TaxID=452863 RepID=B8HD86_PSECP|nr:hypothetical protein [Pseudarthrobacter chlorophenolicus]ACL40732.1 hypothetical protein Achl_2767 [Pseudarthrobacter chlorophenolicus A6]SDQ76074.1 hypothetical protein SAMN04489738_2714 [Pseudarthrobacter chlorophenolicus]